MGQLKDFKVNNFDILRLIAATEVIVDHYFQHLNIPLNDFQLRLLYLFPGVPVFFVISGYLISASYQRNNNLIRYFKNRTFRIFPGLWGCILVTIVVISVTGVSFINKQALFWFPAQLIGVIYTPGFLSNYGFGSYNGSLWTIPIELQFYILLTLCFAIIPSKKTNYWLTGLLIVFIMVNAFYQISHFKSLIAKLIDYSFAPQFYLFITGIILQRLQLYRADWIYNKALYWFTAYVLFALILPGYFNPVIFLIIKNLFLAIVVLSLAYSLPQAAAKLLRGNDISYGVYMYHGLILTVIIQEKWTGYVNLYLLITMAYLLGTLSWILIEKPFIKRKFYKNGLN